MDDADDEHSQPGREGICAAMRLLIVGANGMIGHRVWLAARDRLETWATIRGSSIGQPWAPLFDQTRLIEGVSADNAASFERAFDVSRPDVVVNALGLVKQRPAATDTGSLFEANSFVPQLLRDLCDARNARLIHVSTDCVYQGDKAPYAESCRPDSLEPYALTKRLGEVGAPHLTVRTSVVGRSLSGHAGLVEWFLAQRGEVRGWQRAAFNGLTAATLAETILSIAIENTNLEGTYHIAGERIDKFTFLCRLRDAFGLTAHITPVDEPVIDRSLDDARFRAETGIPRPSWNEMLGALAADPLPYAELRGEQ